MPQNIPDEMFHQHRDFPVTNTFVETPGFSMRLAAMVELQAAAQLAATPSVLALMQQYRDMGEHVALALATLLLSFHLDGIYTEPEMVAWATTLAEEYGIAAAIRMEPL